MGKQNKEKPNKNDNQHSWSLAFIAVAIFTCWVGLVVSILKDYGSYRSKKGNSEISPVDSLNYEMIKEELKDTLISVHGEVKKKVQRIYFLAERVCNALE